MYLSLYVLIFIINYRITLYTLYFVIIDFTFVQNWYYVVRWLVNESINDKKTESKLSMHSATCIIPTYFCMLSHILLCYPFMMNSIGRRAGVSVTSQIDVSLRSRWEKERMKLAGNMISFNRSKCLLPFNYISSTFSRHQICYWIITMCKEKSASNK